jgi:two-component system cell cycle response regulator DivK
MHSPLATARAEPKSAKPRRDQGSESRRPVSTGTRRRPTVLIVDDDEDARELYAWCMRAAGWFVEAVPDAAEALFVAAVLEPDVIVMDLRLPVVGGVEAIRRLKGDDDTKHIPIVACTAFDRSTKEIEARAAGCDAFVAKPCDPEALRNLLEALVTDRSDSSR